MASVSRNCFWRSDNQIHAMGGGWFACNNTQVIEGGAQLCCLQGSQWGPDSICLKNVDYHVGGCTDGSYGDPVCRTSCTGDSQTYIQWNQNTEAWECCGDKGCDGSPPTETFTAIARASWSPVQTAPQSSSTTRPASQPLSTTASSSSMATSTTSTSSTTGSIDGDGDTNQTAATTLSAGAKAGIGVACGLVGLAAILAIALVMIKKRKKNPAESAQQQSGKTETYSDPSSGAHPESQMYVPLEEVSSQAPSELGAQHTLELPTDTTAHVELESASSGRGK